MSSNSCSYINMAVSQPQARIRGATSQLILSIVFALPPIEPLSRATNELH